MIRMAYLTYNEYISFGFTEIDETEFEKLLPKASDVIDSITRYFYRYNNIDDDVPFRREMFKKAIAAQIQYFHDKGGTMRHEIGSPLTINIGRTSVLMGEKNQQSENTIISTDAIRYLSGTGLLYCGIGVVG